MSQRITRSAARQQRSASESRPTRRLFGSPAAADAAEKPRSSSRAAAAGRRSPAGDMEGAGREGNTAQIELRVDEGTGLGESDRAWVQVEALEQLVRTQAQQLQTLRASPPASPARPEAMQGRLAGPRESQGWRAEDLPAPAAMERAAGNARTGPPEAGRPSAAVQDDEIASRFAKREPRASDLREYDGASGAELDEWEQELRITRDLFALNPREVVQFATARLRGAAIQWWWSLGEEERAGIKGHSELIARLRARFQPITAARTAREQLDRLQQGSRHVNEYILEFQRIRAMLPDMGDADAAYAFERGLRRDIAEKLRIQGVSTLQESIALAARVGSLSQAATANAMAGKGHAASANQMEVDSSGGGGPSLTEGTAKALLAAIQAQPPWAGLGAKTQTQRGYEAQRGGFRPRGMQGGRAGGRTPQPINIPGVSAATMEQRRAAGQCFRCGDATHRSVECPNDIRPGQPLN